MIATARVPTPNAAKYIQQLCKHWGHKLKVEMRDNGGTVYFDHARTEMRADDAALVVDITADDSGELDRIKGVVATHLDRFAFREGPLEFIWTSADTAP